MTQAADTELADRLLAMAKSRHEWAEHVAQAPIEPDDEVKTLRQAASRLRTLSAPDGSAAAMRRALEDAKIALASRVHRGALIAGDNAETIIDQALATPAPDGWERIEKVIETGTAWKAERDFILENSSWVAEDTPLMRASFALDEALAALLAALPEPPK